MLRRKDDDVDDARSMLALANPESGARCTALESARTVATSPQPFEHSPSPEHDVRSGHPRSPHEVAGQLADAVKRMFSSPGAVRHELRFQPIVPVDRSGVTAFEVLSRFEIDGLGSVPPAEVFHEAERWGLDGDLTLEVLRSALRDCVAHVLPGVAVNVSHTLLADSGFVASMLRELCRSGLPASSLTIELVEGMREVAVAELGKGVGMLRQAGVDASIDDFGTGARDFQHLCHLAVNEVKLDRSIIVDVSTSSRAQEVVRHLVALGTNHGIRILAEGVEDRATAELVRHLGCGLLQGFWVARPLTALDAVQFCRSRRRPDA